MGRERALAEIEAIVGAGRGGPVLVTGEPGIGKTALCATTGDGSGRRVTPD
ncbi:MAG: ATP-binding protein, partial [Haloechinothrix sp.]